MSEKRCYTVKDLQEILGVSRPSVYDLLKKNEFRWILVGANTEFPRRALMPGLMKMKNLSKALFVVEMILPSLAD